MKNILYKAASAVLIMTAMACSSIDCDIEGRVMCSYQFQSADSLNDVAVTMPVTVTLVPEGGGSDTVYINQQSSLSDFDLPMSYVGDVDKIALTVQIDSVTTLSDTLWVSKTNSPRFESVDCAPRYDHTITAVRSTHHMIDSVVINNPKVNKNATAPNIQIRLTGSGE